MGITHVDISKINFSTIELTSEQEYNLFLILTKNTSEIANLPTELVNDSVYSNFFKSCFNNKTPIISNTNFEENCIITNFDTLESSDVTVSNFLGKIVFNGVDWIYTTTESMLAYDFKIWYLWSDLSIFDDNYDMFFNQYWAASLSISVFQLFYAVLLDKYFNILVHNNPFTNDWFRMMLHSKENALIWLYHPELFWHISSLNQFLTYFYGGIFDFIYFDKSNPDICILAHTLYIHLIILFLIFTAFISILFNFYGNANTEENTVDLDYLTVSSTVEAEKEIASIDDYLGIIIMIMYVFGIFFFTYAWSSIISQSALMLSYYAIIIMFIFVIGMPTLVLYDLGIFFLIYIRGAGKSSNSFIEIVYDYVACTIFYTRILAQWIRIVLMLIVFISLSHYVSEFEIANNMIIGNEDQKDDLSEFNTNSSATYYLLTVLPGKILYWFYEIIHTSFLVISQFIAFFAIVFWLFLFLYTFFIIEKHENFFSSKREERKNKLKNLYKLKIN